MSTIIDRRLNPRDKTIKNRQKFIQRSRDQIKKAVKEAINNGNIADIENGKVRVPVKDISEPDFRTNPKTGNKKYVLPGNKDYVVGDTSEKESEDDGSGGTKGGLGRGEDDFEFVLNADEFLDFVFEDLELPDLVKKQMKDITKMQYQRAGFTNVGTPNQLDVVRSLKNSLGRRIGLKRPTDEEIEEIREKLKICNEYEAKALCIQLEELLRRRKLIPWLDPFDIRYRNYTPHPTPMTKAVMFCLMDISGSMGQREKDLAKRFFFLLHMFLRRKYDKVDIIFIMHHEEAYEVSENDFFYSQENGGTVVSTALKLAKKIIDERYDTNAWNIYVAQCSDGDNFSSDYQDAYDGAAELLRLAQYFAYVEIARPITFSTRDTELWQTYEMLDGIFPNLHMRTLSDVSDIWKVFKELFAKEGTK